LADVKRAEERARRGRLRIFFGASAGVGKTFAMLEAARAARAGGADVVVGYVEPHGRKETERLLDGLEQLPTRDVQYRNIVRHEFDLDAAIARRATITLVDELAHSNPMEAEPRPRHGKRWQDIEELLEAGLDVWTTVNVQHIESLNDLVAGITGVRQQETVPDRVFDEADEVELIDLPADDLLTRLAAGKIYMPDQAGAALERFFRKPNLIALRELALRRTADRVDASARAYRGQEPMSRPWLARDRFLIAVGPDDQGEQLIRVGKRFADALDAEWTVVSVETPGMLNLGEAARNRRVEMLRLAESLGAETVTLGGPTAAAALLEYAKLRNVTRIVVGEAKRRGWRALLRPSTVTELVRRAEAIDISVIGRRAFATRPEGVVADPVPRMLTPAPVRWERYAWGAGVTAACTAVAALLPASPDLINIVMVYLLGATLAGLKLGRGPAVLTAVANVAAFDFCFVPPRFSFATSDVRYALTFAVMLIVALTIANLVANVRQQTRVAGARERRTSLLYAMSRELAGARGLENIAQIAVKHIAETFASLAVVLLPDADGNLQHPHATPVAGSLRAADLSVAQWVFDHARLAGLGTDTLPAAAALYVPLVGSASATSAVAGPAGTLGVLAVLPSNRRRVLLPEQRHLLETFAGQLALAIERTQLARAAESARLAVETESLRNTLLASISHDLRTPLAVIAGASSALIDPVLHLEEAARMRLARSIEGKAREMSELISNVLDLMRFESGEVRLRRDWQALDELAGLAIERSAPRLGDRPVEVDCPDELPQVYVDAALVVQVLTNLLENAARYTPPGTHIRIAGRALPDSVELVVEDDGPGLPRGDPERLFAKFQRGQEESSVAGAGLGLAICRAIVQAHGGRITAGERAGGGARFAMTLPTTQPDSMPGAAE
jgi:two-component system sensor histidine kinase KdpD